MIASVGGSVQARAEVERELGRLVAEMSYADISDILKRGLHEHIDHLQLHINSVGTAVYSTFFAMKPVEQEEEDIPADRMSFPPPRNTRSQSQ